jgi:hypothetical protein
MQSLNDFKEHALFSNHYHPAPALIRTTVHLGEGDEKSAGWRIRRGSIKNAICFRSFRPHSPNQFYKHRALHDAVADAPLGQRISSYVY